MKRTLTTVAAVATAALGLSIGISGCVGSEETVEAGDTVDLAFLSASSQNGYNQAVWEGVQKKAKELEKKKNLKINVKLQDGQFDSNTQLSQLQNVDAGKQADGIITVPQDGISLGAAFPMGNKIPVVTALNPIGADIEDMKPQVDGVVSTVAAPPSSGAKLQADAAVDYCKDIDPCKIALLAGQLNTPLDIQRVDTWTAVLKKHKNIKIVAKLEGQYDRDKSLTAVSNMLQANADINGILSNADQQTFGAEIALKNKGIDPSSVYLTGGGGTKEAVKAVREGRWTNDFLNYPVTAGEQATVQVVNQLLGEDVEEEIDIDALGDFDPLVNKQDLEKHPDFTGEWNG